MLKKRFHLLALLTPFTLVFTAQAKAPRMSVVFVIDQMSAHYIPKLMPYLKGGLKTLAQDGVYFTNAFYDHGMPSTGPGHTLLSTGTYGSVHGIVNNRWFDKQGNPVDCDDDTTQFAVFAPKGKLYPYGKSAQNIMVDTLSDQIIMHSYPHAHNIVWSLSQKSRSAICMAGRLGNAAWFDDASGTFTSSKAYFKKLPEWITRFNQTHDLKKKKSFTWKPVYPLISPAYAFKNSNNYTYAPSPLIGTTFCANKKTGYDALFNMTPLSNQHLLDAAKTCVAENHTCKKTDRFMLWLSLSALDRVGHVYGPQSKEVIDLIYHLDQQLEDFMQSLYKLIPKEEVLFILTADHGIQDVPQLLQDQGFSLSNRYSAHKLISDLNSLIEEKHGIKTMVQNFKEPQFYLDQKILSTLPISTQKSIHDAIKNYLTALPGIRKVWTFDELQNAIFAPYDLDNYLQKQLYKGRSGQIIYSVNPYTMIDTHLKGTSHITQYAYDTQVPLIFYQPGKFTKKRINTNVTMSQVSVTLATLFKVPRPSAATASVLPGLTLL